MSISRHHAEWLSLLEISGPFLSMPVLLRAFPQGLDAHDPDLTRSLRLTYEEWLDNQGGLRADPAIHRTWVEWVLENVLEMPATVIREKRESSETGKEGVGETLAVTLAEHGETIRPDLVIAEPGSGAARLLVMLLPTGQDPDKPLANGRWKVSPAVRMMTLLHATGVRLGLVTNGEQWMLVDGPADGATGYISWYAALWLEEPLTLRAFRTLLGARRFFGVADKETIEALLAASADDQQQVTDQLGYQVRRAVELLVQAIDLADQERGGSLLAGIGENALYETAVTVMMRLVVLLAGEERDLLPLGDPFYDQHYAVSTLRAQLHEVADQHGEEVLERRTDAWYRLLANFRAVHSGIHHDRLHLPAYGGRLFDPDRFPFLEGRPAGTSWLDTPALPLPIDNRTVLHLLDALQVLQVKVPGGGPAEARRLSFRALDIEQIGHVYEGLLDHTAVRAGETVLGLAGTKDREPEVPLSRLEEFIARQDAKSAKGEDNQGFAAFAPLREAEIARQDAKNAKGEDNQGFAAFAPLREIEIARKDAKNAKGEEESDFAAFAPLREHLREDDLIAFLREQTGRSASALRKALAPLIDNSQLTIDHRPLAALRAACHNDDALLGRVLPWAGLIREDDYGRPVVIPAGSVYVTAGSDRRSTGTHYTPRSLTEPIVQHTLEPLVYIGPAEGWPRQRWQLRTPAEILAIRVCDMAMGSGAFLVQADRYLAERLVEAWEAESARQDAKNAKTEEENPAFAAFAPLREAENETERMIIARRLVAERCLYGVDKNPLAVEMAKLSLWLVTMAKGRPFDFLDHALKCGDSLVGVDEEQFLRWSQTLKGVSGPLYFEENQAALAEARAKRRQLQSFVVNDVRDAEEKARLLAEAEAAVARVKRGCHLLVGVDLVEGPTASERDTWRAELLIQHTAQEMLTSAKAQAALAAAEKHNAFHWFLEFPEVFERDGAAANPGFNSFVGNPPFIGGKRISTTFGIDYYQYLRNANPTGKNTTDLVTYFFLGSYRKLRDNGTLGLIATNTIAQGDTREAGLDHIIQSGGKIYAASTSTRWPGTAAVFVSIVHIRKGHYYGPKLLNGAYTDTISSLLDSTSSLGNPMRLQENHGKSFIGAFTRGMGFVITLEEAQSLLMQDPRNAEVVRPYLNGDDLNSNPNQAPSRWVINFYNWTQAKAQTFTGPWRVIEERVYPERMGSADNRKVYSKMWWRFWRPRPELYRTISTMPRVLIIALTSRTGAFAFMPTSIVFTHAVGVFAFDDDASFSTLQSTLHTDWARNYGSSLKGDLRYTPSDVFDTFPFPHASALVHQLMDAKGAAYHEHRRQIMLTRQEGLTTTYNRFHNPDETAADIARLRDLHVAMDQTVAAAYGWDDLALGHGFHDTGQGLRFTIDESARREVLSRLLELNHQRYAEEVAAGLHEKGTAKSRSGAKSRSAKGAKAATDDDGQMSLF